MIREFIEAIALIEILLFIRQFSQKNSWMFLRQRHGWVLFFENRNSLQTYLLVTKMSVNWIFVIFQVFIFFNGRFYSTLVHLANSAVIRRITIIRRKAPMMALAPETAWYQTDRVKWVKNGSFQTSMILINNGKRQMVLIRPSQNRLSGKHLRA